MITYEDALGNYAWVSHVTGGQVWLRYIYVFIGCRGCGHGTALLLQVLAEADANNWTIYLTPQPSSSGLSLEALEAWYMRHGFVPDTSPYILVRRPNGQD